MSVPPHRIGRELVPNTQLEQRLKRIEQALNRRRLLKSPGVLPEEGPDGTRLKLDIRPGGGSEGGSLTRFEIVTLRDDHLECRTEAEDGTASGGLILIAKPTFLRVTGVHGTTRDGWSYNVPALANERTLTNVSASGITVGLRVAQDLDPSYKVGDTIYATEPEGKTGVTVAGTRLTWLDANVDGRHFRHRRIMLDACVLVNNVPTQKTIVFEAGPIP